MDKVMHWCWTVLIAVFAAVVVHQVRTVDHVAPSVVVVDLAGTTESWLANELAAGHDEIVARARARAFKAHAEILIQTLARDEGLIVVPREAVLAGAEDITEAFAAKLAALEVAHE